MKYREVTLSSFLSPNTNPVQISELSQDGRRVKRKAAEATVPSPVKRTRTQRPIDTESPGLSDLFSGVLEDFHSSDHYYVPDSTKVDNSEALINSAALRAKRRYLTSVSRTGLNF